MRITPHDIRQQQFSSKMFKGYDPQEVDAFLDDVAEDYEAVLKEVALLKEQIAAQEERARGVTERERTLQDTLVTTQRLVRLARETGKRVHVLHITTALELDFLKDHKEVASVEVTPHHLTLEAPGCYERLGTYAHVQYLGGM